MKKALSFAVALLLVFSCITTCFASQTATPDEAKKIQALSLTKLPSKLVYDFPDDVNINGKPAESFDPFSSSEDKIVEIISTAVFDININMDGAVITAEYSDGTSAVVDPGDCEIKISDPLTGAQIVEKMQTFQDELNELGIDDETEPDNKQTEAFFKLSAKYTNDIVTLVCRDYTVKVSYGGQSAEFSVKLKLKDIPDTPIKDFEFVSLEEPNPKTYYISRDFEIDEPFDDGVLSYNLKFDTTGMKVKARNVETGEIIEISGDNIELDYSFYSDEGYPKTGKYSAVALAYDEEKGCYVYFEYKFNLVNDLNTSVTKPQSTGKTPAMNKTPTNDEATPAQAAVNGTVQTGEQINFIIPLIILLFSIFTVYAYYRRKTK